MIWAPHFTKIIGENEKKIKDSKKAKTSSNSEKEPKKALRKEKRDVRTLSLVAGCPFASASAVSVPRFISLSASTSTLSMPGLSALQSSALLSVSGMVLLVFRSSVFLLFAFLFASGVSIPVSGLSALLSMLFVFDVTVLMPRLLIPPIVSNMSMTVFGSLTFSSVSGMAMLVFGLSASLSIFDVCVYMPGLSAPLFVSNMLMPGLSAPPSLSAIPTSGLGLSLLLFFIWFFPQTLMPIPKRKRLGQ